VREVPRSARDDETATLTAGDLAGLDLHVPVPAKLLMGRSVASGIGTGTGFGSHAVHTPIAGSAALWPPSGARWVYLVMLGSIRGVAAL
jgi:hypothetical protein